MAGNPVSLEVQFAGLKFKNPFMLSSAPPTTTGEMVARAFDAGWGGAVLKTVSTEKIKVINVSPRLQSISFDSQEGEPKKYYGLENIELITDRPLPVWLEEIKELRRQYPDRVVVASLMAEASIKEDWQELTIRCQEAGASALELNFSCPHGGLPGKQVGCEIGQDPNETKRITRWVKDVATVPVWVKLTPNITDITVSGHAAKEGGADALTAINTVRSLIGINLDTLEPYPSVKGVSAFGGLSGPAVKPLALRLVAELAGSVGLPISGVGGINTWRDAAEFILVGATTLQVCTAVMFNGYEIINELVDGLMGFMEDKGFSSLDEFRGLVLPKLTRVDSLDNTWRVISDIDRTTCVKCNLCYVACRDAGYQAIEIREDRLPYTIEDKCTGCSLCMQVCPVWDCITMKQSQKMPVAH